MIKHAPGPWVISDARSTKVDLINTRKGDAVGEVVFVDVRNPADALLVAAAPELLAALERANTLLAELNFSEWIPKNDTASIDIRQRINAAHVIASSSIAKATGGAA
jgi:hypothetical protein